jgi:hypothetical protein
MPTLHLTEKGKLKTGTTCQWSQIGLNSIEIGITSIGNLSKPPSKKGWNVTSNLPNTAGVAPFPKKNTEEMEKS